jgi:excisionase family DNA binding protein
MSRQGAPTPGVNASLDTPDRLLDVREAAALLRLQPRTVYKLAYERRLPVVKVGRATRFRLMSLMELIAAWEQPAAGPSSGSASAKGRK